jgi:hypothetical protein
MSPSCVGLKNILRLQSTQQPLSDREILKTIIVAVVPKIW